MSGKQSAPSAAAQHTRSFLWAYHLRPRSSGLGLAQGAERTKAEAAAVTLAVMIFVGTVLTAFGIYDELAEKGGGEPPYPSRVLPTRSQRRPWIPPRRISPRYGGKMFVIAGPVIVFGILSGFLVALAKALILGLF